jgi:hypothetical protein
MATAQLTQLEQLGSRRQRLKPKLKEGLVIEDSRPPYDDGVIDARAFRNLNRDG